MIIRPKTVKQRCAAGFKLLNDELTGILAVLVDQCKNKIQNMQEDHRSVSKKCVGLELAKVNVNENQEL